MSIKEDAKTSPWDTADYLKTQEDISDYLEIAFESGDPQEVYAALGVVARAQGMMGVSKKAGLNRANLYTSLTKDGNPSYETVDSVMDALGYRLMPVPTGSKQRVKI